MKDKKLIDDEIKLINEFELCCNGLKCPYYVEIYCVIEGEERILHTRSLNHWEAKEYIEIAKNDKNLHYRIKS